MKSFELLLTILFISIIYLITFEQPNRCIIGICSLLFITVWASNNVKEFSIKEGLQNKKNTTESDEIVSNSVIVPLSVTDKQQADTTDAIIQEKVLRARSQSKKVPENEPKLKPISERPVQLEYSENNYKYNLFDEIGSLGDNKIAHLMKHVSNKNRVAIDNMSRQNKYTNINYFAEELNDHSNSIWWDDETLEKEF